MENPPYCRRCRAQCIIISAATAGNWSSRIRARGNSGPRTGRSITGVDISPFIRHLPNRRDTRCFSTEDASGSTSQAANLMESMESGSTLLLIDEDTSATNFMIRDKLMQQVVSPEEEPIIPFIERVRSLYEDFGISSIIVAGSSGSYFHVADTIVQMKEYTPSGHHRKSQKSRCRLSCFFFRAGKVPAIYLSALSAA